MKTFKLIIMTTLLLLLVAGLFLSLLEVPVNTAGAIAYIVSIILVLTNYETDRRLYRIIEEERAQVHYYRQQIKSIMRKIHAYMSRSDQVKTPMDTRQPPKKKEEISV